MTRNAIRLLVACLLALATLLYVRWHNDQLPHGAMAQKITCVNNLKQIGLAIRTFAIDNDGRFPFNLSTNSGGTLELCRRGSGGFDSNAAIHFQVASNELSTPKILVCPKDRSKKPATVFSLLTADNVTYRLRTGTNITEEGPKKVLAECPIDGNKLYTDGSVMDSKGHAVLPFDPTRVPWQTNQ